MISKIGSIELDRSVPFSHVVRIKDRTGYSLEVIPVQESTGFEQFKLIYESWAKHPDANLSPPTEKELYEGRKK